VTGIGPVRNAREPREADGALASPFNRWANATSAGSVKVSTSISLITFEKSSSAADSVDAERLSAIALARLPSQPITARLISERIAT
jgi:hypothetical protein